MLRLRSQGPLGVMWGGGCVMMISKKETEGLITETVSGR